jgi:hypothetical protein
MVFIKKLWYWKFFIYTLLQELINIGPRQFFSKHALMFLQDRQVGLATIVIGKNITKYVISIQ